MDLFLLIYGAKLTEISNRILIMLKTYGSSYSPSHFKYSMRDNFTWFAKSHRHSHSYKRIDVVIQCRFCIVLCVTENDLITYVPRQ